MNKQQEIFGGDESREMWGEINSARSVADLRRALYGVCCKLQELESLVRRIRKARAKGKRKGRS